MDPRVRLHLGWLRLRAAFWPVIQAGIAAVIAYLLGLHLLGHSTPFFASIAAWACLGFGFDRSARRIIEVGVGVTLGVTMGDLVVTVIGSGWWQLGSVLVVTALLSRFVDRGAVLAAQAGTQAIVIVGLPALQGGPFGRAADTVVGALVALAVALLAPADPRAGIRRQGQAALAALAETVNTLAQGVSVRSDAEFFHALEQGRHSESVLDEWLTRSDGACKLARYSVNRRHLKDLETLRDQAIHVERAMRSVRVIARNAPVGMRHASDADCSALATVLVRFNKDIVDFRERLGSGADTSESAESFVALHTECDPEAVGMGYADNWGIRALTALARSPIRDLAIAAGTDPHAEV
ncbi:MAG: FUSC family protein [Cellulomonadaceae bacterium]|nr:FUSC family protein [Cellulomonadaceae bacterium]